MISILSAFPKIFAIGQRYTEKLFSDEVEITEKLDGSQIAFGLIDGELRIRSKGAPIYLDNPDKMFGLGVEVIKSIADKLLPNMVYYGEYLKVPRHNVISYGRVPINHIALFAILGHENGVFYDHPFIAAEAERLGLEAVWLMHQGRIHSIEELKINLSKISALGKEKIEGFVVKNYHQSLVLGSGVIPILAGKYVSEDFKEVHKKNWKKENTGKGKWEVYKDQFTAPARWLKAIHRLRDQNELEFSPKDIGKLIKHIQQDLMDEEAAAIRDWLYDNFIGEITRTAIKGFPEWYKNYLLERAMKSE